MATDGEPTSIDRLGEVDLGRALRDAGSPYAVAELEALLAGLAAAPETGTAGDESLWMSLVAPVVGPELAASLRALRREAATRMSTPLDRNAVPARVARLRTELRGLGLAGFLIPRADEYQGEYVPLGAQRLLWLTGFEGSAGMAVVLLDEAAIFVDGRYTLQVRSQVPVGTFTPHHVTESPPQDWIAAHLPKSGRLGYDPRLHTEAEVARLRAACDRAGGSLEACGTNPVDTIWSDRPPAPLAPIVPHPLEYAGRSAADKRAELAAALRASGHHAAVLTSPDSIAWLLNLRGGDVAHTPLPLSFAILHDDAGVDLFVDRRKLVPAVPAHLGNGVVIRPPAEFDPALDELGRSASRVLVDPAMTSAGIIERLTSAGVVIARGQDPCALPKARKNDVEIAGARAAHARDAVALCRFLAWLSGNASSGITELDAEDRLLAFRQELPLFRDLSFPTISGAGRNGAIVHYRASEETNRALEPGSLYLVDSGAQFVDGTTDVTRTIAVGHPSHEQRDAFTRVLKGHIALATVRFPKGTTGSQLDVLARVHLWAVGLDFDHGTGHGIGSYLSVHEGPQRVSKAPSTVALEAGMIISDEPGYYRTGAWGIRTENLLLVVPVGTSDHAEREMLAFETLTLAPIDRSLVDTALLTAGERQWLDDYHARVRASVGPKLNLDARAWLEKATAPLT